MRSMLRSFSLPIRSTSCESTKSANNKIVLPPLQSEEDLHIDKLCQFKEAVKRLDIPLAYDSDDYYYLKWLRARRYSIEKAKEMLKNHLEWRQTYEYIDDVMNYIAPNEVLEQFKWKRIGNDAKGRPIFCFLIGRIDVHYLLENKLLEDIKRYVAKIFELCQSISDEQRRLTGYGKIILVIDLTDFTFSKAMNMEVIQFAMNIARIFEANYPELLYRAYIINSNWFFTTLYNACKPFLAQETLQKIQIHGYYSDKYLPALETTIPNELIPEEFGGTGDSVEEFEIIA